MHIINCSSGETVSAASLPFGAVFLLGYFDGVHRGHRALIDCAAGLAEGKAVAAWMFEHLPKGDILTDNAEKCALLHSYGVDYAVEIVPHFTMDGIPVSSTAIRTLIAQGHVDKAAELLGRPYSLTLPVMHGHQIGRTIGHPTINQIIPHGRLSPSRGVYSCIVEFTDRDGIPQIRGGVCNIGSRPTVNRDENDVTLETYIFDYSGDLYDLPVRTSFCEKLRDERKFASVEELAEQIARDSEHALQSLAGRF